MGQTLNPLGTLDDGREEVYPFILPIHILDTDAHVVQPLAKLSCSNRLESTGTNDLTGPYNDSPKPLGGRSETEEMLCAHAK